MQAQNLELKRFLRKNLYQHERVMRMSTEAAGTINNLFNIFMRDTALLPAAEKQRVSQKEQEDGATGRARIVADYIAGMTDRYAIAEYERIVST